MIRYFDSQLDELPLQTLLPNTSNPEVFTTEELLEKGIYVLTEPAPVEGYRWIPVSPTLEDGVLVGGWEQEEIVVPPTPNWDGFNATMLSDTAFNQTMGVVMGSAPAVAVAIPAALSQVAANGVSAFALAFNAFCQVGQVTTQQRSDWADIAESFDLPVEFVDVVRG